MRIVYIDNVIYYGGAAQAIVSLLKRLSDHVDVSVVIPYGSCTPFVEAVEEAKLDLHVLFEGTSRGIIGGQEKGKLYRLWRIVQFLPNFLTARARVKALLKELRPSVVLSNNFKGAALTGFTWSLRHVPLVMYMLTWYTPRRIPWYGKWLLRKRCSAVFALSYAIKGALVCSQVDPERIRVLYDPYDVDEMLELARRPLDTPLPQTDRAVRILLPAVITRTKGQHTAVKTLKKVLDAGLDAVLWLAGEDQDLAVDRGYLEATRKLSEDLGVSDRVEWIGLRHDLPQVIKQSSIVILPSHSEGMGRVIQEAMSLGVPVAATPVGGLLDIVLPGITGLRFEVEDDQGLSDCIMHVVNNPDQIAPMIQNAQNHIRLNFTADSQVRNAMEVFEQVIGSQVILDRGMRNPHR